MGRKRVSGAQFARENVHQTKVYGIKSSYIKFNLPEDDDATDKDGFMQVEKYEQETLPFD